MCSVYFSLFVRTTGLRDTDSMACQNCAKHTLRVIVKVLYKDYDDSDDDDGGEDASNYAEDGEDDRSDDGGKCDDDGDNDDDNIWWS